MHVRSLSALVALLTCPVGCLETSTYQQADLSRSSITTPSPNALANGVDGVPVLVTAMRKDGMGVAGLTVTVAVDKCSVAQPKEATGENGQATAWVTCNDLGPRTVTATVTLNDFSLMLPCTTTINFYDASQDGNTTTDGATNTGGTGTTNTGATTSGTTTTGTTTGETTSTGGTTTGETTSSTGTTTGTTTSTTGTTTGGTTSTAGTTTGTTTSTTGGTTTGTTTSTTSGTTTGTTTGTTGGTTTGTTTGGGSASCHEVGGGTYIVTSNTAPATTRVGDLALDLTGKPILAYIDNTYQSNVYIQVFDGSSWGGLSGSGSGKGLTNRVDGVMQSPSLRTLNNGAPAVTWLTQAGDGFFASYLYWNGTIWADLGNNVQIFNTVSTGGNTALAINSNNVPFAVWDINGVSLVDRAWGGSSWNGISSANETFATSITPSAAVDAAGAPLFTWVDQSDSSNSKILVAHYAAAVWASYGSSGTGSGISGNTTNATWPAMAVDANHNPVVAWQAGNNVYLQAWNGSAWEQLDGSGSGNGISGNSGTSTTASHPSVVVDANGLPLVAWEDSASGQIYMRHYDGTTWADDQGSSSGAGMTSTASAAYWPRLALDANQRPVMFWQESATTTHLHVCTWY